MIKSLHLKRSNNAFVPKDFYSIGRHWAIAIFNGKQNTSTNNALKLMKKICVFLSRTSSPHLKIQVSLMPFSLLSSLQLIGIFNRYSSTLDKIHNCNQDLQTKLFLLDFLRSFQVKGYPTIH